MITQGADMGFSGGFGFLGIAGQYCLHKGTDMIEDSDRDSAGAQVVLSGVQPQPLSMLDRMHLGVGSDKVFHSSNFADAQSLALTLLEILAT
ncbi:MAG: hypothetical protein U5J78_00125 [Parasphingorhabdus sp.]|nr:hypothetical protein [Parasphingorhabdus sp.]